MQTFSDAVLYEWPLKYWRKSGSCMKLYRSTTEYHEFVRMTTDKHQDCYKTDIEPFKKIQICLKK